MSRSTAWQRAGLVLVVVLGLDQLTKALARGALDRGEDERLIPGILKLVNVRNDGVAFGALGGGDAIIAVVGILAVSALLAYFHFNAEKKWVWLPVGMLLGGAIGNAIDRIAEGEVTDFLKLPSWPAFNVADIAITFGVIFLVLVIEFGDGARGKS